VNNTLTFTGGGSGGIALNFHFSTKRKPFEVVFWYPPPLHIYSLLKDSPSAHVPLLKKFFPVYCSTGTCWRSLKLSSHDHRVINLRFIGILKQSMTLNFDSVLFTLEGGSVDTYNMLEREGKTTKIKNLFVCWKIIIFFKVNFKKINYFLMFGSVMKNKLENILQCLVMSWKIRWKITY